MSAIDLGPYPDSYGYSEAVRLDKADPLRSFAARFTPLDDGVIYLDGNSLGRLPSETESMLHDVVVNQWGRRLIRSWPEQWWDLADEIGGAVAALVGARPDEVIITDSTSVALFKLAVAALQAHPERSRIVTDNLNFPTDTYVVEAAAALAGGHEIVAVESTDGVHGPVDEIIAELNEDTALLTLSHVVFKSSYMYDMERVTRAAHGVGAVVLWDLSHSVGVVPTDLDGCGVDLAVGCTYKYLNGGPGSPAFIYVNNATGKDLRNPLRGWWGHRSPFAFDLGYEPAPTIRRFQTGTMPILSLAAIGPGVALTAEARLHRIRAKSVGLSEYFIDQSEHILRPFGFKLASPRRIADRGSHVSLQHPDGWRIVQALNAARIIPDFREPDNLRFGLAPLYTTYLDVHTAIGRLSAIMSLGAHLEYSPDRHDVT